MRPDQQERINELCSMTWHLDRYYGRTERDDAIDPIVQGRRMALLSDAEADEVIEALTDLTRRDREGLLDESDAYEPDDPKNPAYVEAVLDRADLDRKREKGEP